MYIMINPSSDRKRIQVLLIISENCNASILISESIKIANDSKPWYVCYFSVRGQTPNLNRHGEANGDEGEKLFLVFCHSMRRDDWKRLNKETVSFSPLPSSGPRWRQRERITWQGDCLLSPSGDSISSPGPNPFSGGIKALVILLSSSDGVLNMRWAPC